MAASDLFQPQCELTHQVVTQNILNFPFIALQCVKFNAESHFSDATMASPIQCE